MNPITKFFVDLFELLKLYSRQNGLSEHLAGMTPACDPLEGQSIYTLIFVYLVVINSVIVVNYYYGYFNRIPFNKWTVWFMNVLLGAGILYLIAFTYPHNDLENQQICPDLVITTSDCVGFGLTAAIYSIVYSVFFSYLIKWWSSINRIVNPLYLF